MRWRLRAQHTASTSARRSDDSWRRC